MTVDELKQTAKEMGYNIIKKPESIKLLPCKCGCKRREKWFGVKEEEKYILQCRSCGAKVAGRTPEETKRNWNRMVGGEK